MQINFRDKVTIRYFDFLICLEMGSEQSHALNAGDGSSTQRTKSGQLQRGYTIAAPISGDRQTGEGSSSAHNSRPVSPPMSVCSDSDLPYISYTNKPIGGNEIPST